MPRAVPHALETLLRLAAAHEPFAEALLKHRGRVASAVGVTLNHAEQRLITAISEERLRSQIVALRHSQPNPQRRRLLKQAALALVTLAAGGLAAACDDGMMELFPDDRRTCTLGHTILRRNHNEMEVLFTAPLGDGAGAAFAGKRIQLLVVASRRTAPDRLRQIRKAVGVHGAVLCAAFLNGRQPIPQDGGAVITLRVGANGEVEDVRIQTRWVHGPTVEYGIFSAFSELQFAPAETAATLRFELLFRMVDRRHRLR